MINCTFVREIYHNIKHIVAYLEIVQIRVGNFSPSDVEFDEKLCKKGCTLAEVLGFSTPKPYTTHTCSYLDELSIRVTSETE